MKLASFRVGGVCSWGVVENGRVMNVGAILGDRFAGLRQVIAAEALDEVRSVAPSAPALEMAEVRWLPVIPDPGKILCIGLNYETHRLETGRDKAVHPAVFTRFADSQVGHNEPIIRPVVSNQLDYEGELAVIIGNGGRYIDQADAMAHVAGYACYNDATLRDWQRHTIQFTPGKNFPGTGGFGPWMVTSDAAPPIADLHLTTRVNDQIVQDASLDQLIFSIPQLIEYCSAFTQLSPGDVIATGTPGGVGFKREPQLFLQPGDQVHVEISGIGVLSNGVVDETRG
jgi:2-keto-4-pentenoate hydratase/2-oxohepta-3-ene-1,7-dioic acid hydratase in catechol pathway